MNKQAQKLSDAHKLYYKSLSEQGRQLSLNSADYPPELVPVIGSLLLALEEAGWLELNVTPHPLRWDIQLLRKRNIV